MTPTLVFAIETIPDTNGLLALLDVPSSGLVEDVANIAFHRRKQHKKSSLLSLID